jgi:poly(3-hydroxybutyrate) depolymerase
MSAEKTYMSVPPTDSVDECGEFNISEIQFNGTPFPVREQVVLRSAFCVLVGFSLQVSEDLPKVLIVAPLSGHHACLLREVIIGLLPYYEVYITNWTNAQNVPADQGKFGFDDNIGYLLEMLGALGTGTNVIALCQSVVPSLAAVSILEQRNDGHIVRSLVLIGGPVDPLINPTRVVNLLRMHSLEWFEDHVVQSVPAWFPGHGRPVYPAHMQRIALMTYLSRHVLQRGELYQKVLFDDGADRDRFPFIFLFCSLMDLPAEFFLENIRVVFHQRDICCGTLSWCGQTVDPSCISATSLMTIEGALDDIAAPGQTSAAHRLCSGIPDPQKVRLIADDCGHFSLFYGQKWRNKVLPAILKFFDNLPARSGS